MKTIASMSFNGGQGKSTTALMVGRILSEGYRVLLVDCEPLCSLTSWVLGKYKDPDLMSIKDVLEKKADPADCLFGMSPNLSLLPSEDDLVEVEAKLLASGRSAMVLRQRLASLGDKFDYCIIDTPPEQIQLAMTSLGAADAIIIPALANLKGTQSLGRTIRVVQEFEEDMGRTIEILGVLPFQVAMYGYRMASDAKQALLALEGMANHHGFPMLQNVIRSDQFDRALSRQKTLQQMGEKYAYLELPFQQAAEIIAQRNASEWRTNYINPAAIAA